MFSDDIQVCRFDVSGSLLQLDITCMLFDRQKNLYHLNIKYVSSVETIFLFD